MTNAIVEQFANFVSTTVAGGAGGVGTTLNPADTTLHVGDASALPTPDTFHQFSLTLSSGATSEIVRCTARSGSTLTITRAQEGTTAGTFGVGSTVALELTAGNLSTAQSVLATINNQYLYLPPGWDSAWRAAKANSGSTPASIVGIGDSVTAGQGASDIMSTTWWALLRQYLLNQGYTLGGDHYSLNYASALKSAGTSAAYPITQNGTVTTDFASGTAAWNYSVHCTTTILTPWMTCTPPYAVTGFDIIYADYTAGTPSFSYNVDGGTNTNVNTTGPGTFVGTIIKKISITGLASGTHTLNINTKGVSVGCVILGITAYASTTAGLRFANMGWGGLGLTASATATDYLTDTTNFPPDRLGLYQGYQGTSASPTSLTGFGFPMQPDLAIIALGINDAIGSASATTYRDNLRRLVQALRYGKSDACSILICGMYWGDGSTVGSTSVNSSDWTGTQYPGLQDLYEAMRKVAQEYNCGYATVHTLFGRTPATHGWTTSATDGHPTNSGHSKIATLLEAVL